MTFEEYLSDNAHIVNEFIDACFTGGQVADIERYLYGPLGRYSSNAGKRHRPLVCMLACAAVGGDPLRALRPAVAIENFHTAALIHDDISDDSYTRRGLPCMHVAEGLGIAINSGDMALTSVIQTVIDDEGLDDALKLRVLGEVTSMVQATVEGQALDIGWARDRRFDIGRDDYLLMATRKTAVYSGGSPLAIGAIVGGADDETVEALREFGLMTGLAFQIQDDLLNLIGSEEATGKDFRSDITEGKRTYAAICALANSAVRDELISILDAGTHDETLLARAVELMEQAGAIEEARAYAYGLTDKAKELLLGALPDSPARDVMLSMADYFVERLR